MKLAFFIFKYFPYGGLEKDMLQIALACIERGHEVVVYTTRWEGEVPQRIKVNLIKKRGLTNHARMKNFSDAIKKIQGKYDLRIGFNRLANLDLCFVGDVCFKYRYQKKSKIFKLLSSRYKTYVNLEEAVFSPQSNTQIMLVNSQQKAEYLQCYKTPENRLHVLPPGIQKNNYSMNEQEQIRQEIRGEFHINSKEVVLLFVGSSFYTKGLDRVLKAMAKLDCSEIVLWVIGKDKINPYQKLVRNLRLIDKVRFLGAQSNVQSFMLGADVFVNPARVESAGKAILEAMTMGLPVIITENCGYSSYVKEANAGIIIPERFHVNDLVSALRKMVDNKRMKWRDNASYYSKTKDLYSLNTQVVNLIEFIIKGVKL